MRPLIASERISSGRLLAAFFVGKGALMSILAYLLARFSEPSSYAGVGAILALAGWNLSDTILGQLAQALAAGCGLVALTLKERGLINGLGPVAVVAAGALLVACAAA